MWKWENESQRFICWKLCRLKAYTEQVNKIMQSGNDGRRLPHI